MLRVFVLLACFLAVFSAPAETVPPALNIVVGVENHDYFPHYGMKGENQFHGVARAILDAFAVWKGIQLTYKPLPVERLFHELVAGDVDLKYPDHPAWGLAVKGKAEIAYSLPVAEFIDGVLLRPRDKPRQVEDIKQLATILGFTLPSFWQTRVDSGAVKRIGVKHFDSLLLMALIGERVDGIYANVDVGLYRLQQIKTGKSEIPIPSRLQESDTLVFAPELPHDRSYYHLSSRAHPELIKEFDRFLVEQAAEVAALKHKYLQRSE